MTITLGSVYACYGVDVSDVVNTTEISDVYDLARSAAIRGGKAHVQVVSHHKRNARAMVTTSVQSPKCWCEAKAAYVRDRSDASDYGFVCSDHTNDFMADIVPIS